VVIVSTNSPGVAGSTSAAGFTRSAAAPTNQQSVPIP
jgi:hypothetical protein